MTRAALRRPPRRRPLPARNRSAGPAAHPTGPEPPGAGASAGVVEVRPGSRLVQRVTVRVILC